MLAIRRIVLWSWPGCTVSLRITAAGAHKVLPLDAGEGWWQCRTCRATFRCIPGFAVCPNDWRRRRR